LVRPEGVSRIRRGRRKVRGVLVGKINSADLLTEHDFDDARRARVEAVERRYHLSAEIQSPRRSVSVPEPA